MANELCCHVCGDAFIPSRSDQIYCKRVKEAQCLCCRESFSYTCQRREKIFCGRSCASRYGQLSGKLKDALERKYGEGIRNPSQIADHHSESDRAILNEKSRKADRLSKMYPHLKNIDDLVGKSRSEWAIDFLEKNGRRPRIVDYRSHFNLGEVRLKSEEKRHFDLARLSYHEHRFQMAIEGFGMVEGEDFFRHRRFLRDQDGRPLEIDFFFPRQMVGFEIQDFATHDRGSDSVPGVFGSLKRGPEYHRSKARAAASFGVKLIEIWEDELIDEDELERTIGFSLMEQEINGEEFQPYADELARFRAESSTELPNNYYAQEGLLPWWRRG